MREYLNELENWKSSNDPIAMARVIKTWGSSPRPTGSLMYINKAGNIIGSVSGGCVEGAVVKNTQTLFDSQLAAKQSFGVSDEEAWSCQHW